jgi:hypothetical protein
VQQVSDVVGVGGGAVDVDRAAAPQEVQAEGTGQAFGSVESTEMGPGGLPRPPGSLGVRAIGGNRSASSRGEGFLLMLEPRPVRA